MRIGIVIDWNVNASSLMGIARNMFRELGKMMNSTQTFTITALRQDDLGICKFGLESLAVIRNQD